MIGRLDSPPTKWDSSGEYIRWIGKPWRRIEVLTRTFYYNGRTETHARIIQLHLGSRRLGVSATLILSHDDYDYSEEQQ